MFGEPILTLERRQQAFQPCGFNVVDHLSNGKSGNSRWKLPRPANYTIKLVLPTP